MMIHTALEYVEQSSAGSVLPMAPSLHSGLFMGGNILLRDGLHMCQVYSPGTDHMPVEYHRPIQFATGGRTTGG